MTMKKIYQKPNLDVELSEATQMLALSLGKYDTGADDDVVLVRQEIEWDIWGDDSNEEE